MEEHAFDPVRAVASLSPSSLLCPTGALRVLGSGFIGIVFLEEEPWRLWLLFVIWVVGDVGGMSVTWSHGPGDRGGGEGDAG